MESNRKSQKAAKNEYLQEKSIFLQKIELQAEQIVSLTQRLDSQKQLYDSLMDTIQKQQKRRKEQHELVKKKLHDMVKQAVERENQIEILKEKLRNSQNQREQIEKHRQNDLINLQHKLQQTEFKLNILGDMLQSETRRYELLKQRYDILQQHHKILQQRNNDVNNVGFPNQSLLLDKNSNQIKDQSQKEQSQKYHEDSQQHSLFISLLRNSDQNMTPFKNPQAGTIISNTKIDMTYCPPKQVKKMRTGIIMSVREYHDSLKTPTLTDL